MSPEIMHAVDAWTRRPRVVAVAIVYRSPRSSDAQMIARAFWGKFAGHVHHYTLTGVVGVVACSSCSATIGVLERRP